MGKFGLDRLFKRDLLEYLLKYSTYGPTYDYFMGRWEVTRITSAWDVTQSKRECALCLMKMSCLMITLQYIQRGSDFTYTTTTIQGT